MILLSYIKYRKMHPELHEKSVYKMPGGIVMCYACLAFLVFSLYLFTRDKDTLKGMIGLC